MVPGQWQGVRSASWRPMARWLEWRQSLPVRLQQGGHHNKDRFLALPGCLHHIADQGMSSLELVGLVSEHVASRPATPPWSGLPRNGSRGFQRRNIRFRIQGRFLRFP